MKNWTIAAAFGAALLLGAQTALADPVRFLIVGDSWAEEQWDDGSHNRVFLAQGLSMIGVSGELTTTSGSTAADWVMPVNLDRIGNALQQYPHIDTVQLTIGGNDFLDQWNINFTPEQFDTLIAGIRQDVEFVSTYILNQRDDIEIIVSLYDYPNFEDTRNGLIWTFACSPLWNSLGQPNPLQVNTAAVVVIDAIEEFADANPRISHVRHLGQAQNFFGLPGQPPGTIPAPGVVSLPSPAAAMRERFLFGGLDCFHFNATAYDVLIENLVEGYISERFQPGLTLTQTASSTPFTGEALAPPIETVPAVDSLVISYDGSTETPVNAGSYAITVTAPGWQESLTGTWVIEQASQVITVQAPTVVVSGAAPILLAPEASSGLPVTLSLISGPAELDGDVLSFTGALGTVQLRAEQPGDDNWLAETLDIIIDVRSDELFDDRFGLNR